jgi:hypothetical protein
MQPPGTEDPGEVFPPASQGEYPEVSIPVVLAIMALVLPLAVLLEPVVRSSVPLLPGKAFSLFGTSFVSVAPLRTAPTLVTLFEPLDTAFSTISRVESFITPGKSLQ